MLPIHDALPGLQAALAKGPNAVLVAPPGAGKTTVVPLALLVPAAAAAYSENSAPDACRRHCHYRPA